MARLNLTVLSATLSSSNIFLLHILRSLPRNCHQNRHLTIANTLCVHRLLLVVVVVVVSAVFVVDYVFFFFLLFFVCFGNGLFKYK